MTIVNVLKIPNQIQFGLEKSLTKYSVEYYSEVSVEHSCPEDSKHSSFISVEHSSEYSVAHSCVISAWETTRSTSLHRSLNSTEHLMPAYRGMLRHMGPEGVLNWKKHPSFLLMPNSHKLRKDSKNVNVKIGSWGPKKLSQIFNMPIIKSVARKGQNTPKSDFRGPKIPPRGASSTWNM